MRSVNGTLSPTSQITNASYAGHYLLVEFSQLIGKPGGSLNATKPQNLHIPVNDDGSFFFQLPAEDRINGDVRITVKSPTGTSLHSANYSYGSLNTSAAADAESDNSAPLDIAVDPAGQITLSNIPNNQPYKVRGRLLRFEDGSSAAGCTIFIYGTVRMEQEGDGKNPPPEVLVTGVIATAVSDKDGYWTVEIKDPELTEAYAMIAGKPDKQHALVFSPDEPGKLDRGQIIVAEGLGTHTDDGDCGCGCQGNDGPPRLPDAEDMAASSVFSDELGGKCVDFTTPNRSLEEFSYFTVVRTTEPEFKKLPYTAPPILRPGPRNLVTDEQLDPEVDNGSDVTTNARTSGGSESPTFDSVTTGTTTPTSGTADQAPTTGGTDQNTTTTTITTTVTTGTATPNKQLLFATLWESYMRESQHKNRKWWIFPMPALEYHTTYVGTIPKPSEHEASDPILLWKQTVADLYQYLYDDTPKGTELYDFLQFIRSEFVRETRRPASTPDELENFVRHFFQEGSRGRIDIDGKHPIDWDETPTLYQNTTIAHGHILHFKQTWKADGYSLGDLLYSLPLAPCQKKQIAIFDWGRTESATRGEETTVDERLEAFLDRDRDVIDVINTSLTEDIRGGSSTETDSETKTRGFGIGSGVAASGKEPNTGIMLGVTSGISYGSGKQTSSGSATSSAWQTGARDLTGKSMQNLRDMIMQGASAVRNQRSTVVQAVSQGESMNVQTEVIANHNHCHSLTMEYFEVLRHFAIEQKVVDVQECLFIPLEITPFSLSKSLRWRDELIRAIGSRRLREGFEAMVKIRDSYSKGYDPGILATETIGTMHGEVQLSININRPKDNDDEDQSVNEPNWGLLERLLGSWNVSRIRAEWEKKAQAVRDRIWRTEILPEIMANFIDNIELGYIDSNNQKHKLNFDLTVETDPAASYTRSSGKLSIKQRSMLTRLKSYRPGQLLRVFFRLLPGSEHISRDEVKAFYVQNPFELPNGSVVLFQGGYGKYTTPSLNEFLFKVRSDRQDLDGANDFAWVNTPLNKRESFDPVQDAYDKANALITHLNQHLEHYHKMIWYQMDPDKRFMMLDGFVAPNSGGRSVASVVANKLVGVVGNNLVMPVARGVRLDPTFKQEGDDPIDLLAHYAPDTPMDPFRLSVPTRGVYAEAVMGQCNSCEKIDESRHWRFTEVPCGDEPTQIGTISTDSRRTDPGDLQAKDLPANIVNIQNAPAAPNPQGLSDAIAAVSSNEAFGNITGLDGNQKTLQDAIKLNSEGAQAALKTNVEAAQKYAEMAKDLAMHASSIRNTDKVLDRIDQLENAGHLDEKEANDLRKKAIEGMIPKSSSQEQKEQKQEDKKEPEKKGAKSLIPDNAGSFASYEASDNEGTIKFTTPVGSYGLSAGETTEIALDEDFWNSTMKGWVEDDEMRYQAYKKLLTHRPDSQLMDDLADRFGHTVAPNWFPHPVPHIKDSVGDTVNIDMYWIDILEWPTDMQGLSDAQLYGHFRNSFNTILEDEIFWPYDDDIDGAKWNSNDPVGTVMGIYLHWTDDGSVVCSEHNSDNWIFTTLWTPDDGYHPVTGNRMFGLRKKTFDGKDRWTIWTMAVDGITDSDSLIPDSWTINKVFNGGHEFWTKFFGNIKSQVEKLGGEARDHSVMRCQAQKEDLDNFFNTNVFN